MAGLDYRRKSFPFQANCRGAACVYVGQAVTCFSRAQRWQDAGVTQRDAA